MHPSHSRYDEDERRNLDAAPEDLAADYLIDLVTDVAGEIFTATEWDEAPPEANSAWRRRRVAAAAIAAMGLRTTRSIALIVRAGYGPEALPGIRKLQELAGHAQQNAEDVSGQYAQNWFEGRGRAGSAGAAFKTNGGDNETWRILSSASHGAFSGHAAIAFRFTESLKAEHRTGPSREFGANSDLLWIASRILISILAGVLKVHPDADQTSFLAAAEKVIAATPQLPSGESDAATRS